MTSEMRRRNPYPGVCRVIDRHGKERWRFRMKGRPSSYLPGAYGSKEFERAYYAALNARIEVAPRFDPGTFNWLVELYRSTPDYQNLKPRFQRNLALEMERFCREHGHRSVAGLDAEVVEILIGRKAGTPAAANKLLKLLRRLCTFAVKRKIIRTDPTYGVKPIRYATDGFHTWTKAEIARFEAHHGTESKAVLAMRLMLYTGAARQDVIRLGWQNVRENLIVYRRHKTGGEAVVRIHPELAEVLATVPGETMLFLTHTGGRPYKPETFSNWFKDQCRAAGLPHCSTHGLRKAGATRLAEHGATEFEIMTFLGHKTPDEARTYVKTANRVRLADSAAEKLLSNHVERLDINRRKALKLKRK